MLTVLIVTAGAIGTVTVSRATSMENGAYLETRELFGGRSKTGRCTC